MLELSLNGNVIPIPADFSMPMVINTSFCNFEKIPFCYAIDFSLPENEWTRKYFGHPERFTKKRTGKDQTLPGFRAAFSGTTFISGSLKINGFNNGSYDLTAIDNLGVLSEEQQNKTILDIAKFKEAIPWTNSANFSEANSPYTCFPVNNLNFFKDKGVVIERTEQRYNEQDEKWEDKQIKMELLKWLHIRNSSGQMNDLAEDGTVRAVANTIDATDLSQKNDQFYRDGVVSVVSPFFFLNWIIQEALKTFNFFVDENYFDEDTDLKNLCIYNNYDLTLTAFEKTNETYEDWMNGTSSETGNFESVGYVFNKYIRSYAETLIPANHLPKMTIGELLVSTQNLLNLVFDFLPNNKVNIYQRDEILKGEAIDLDKYFIKRWYPEDKKFNSIKFSHEIDDNDLIFSEKYTDLSDRRSDIKDPVADWDALLAIANPDEGEIRFVKSSQLYAEYKWYTPEETDDETYNYTTKDVIGWQQISIGYQNGWWKHGRDQAEEIKTKWSTCYGFGTTVSVLQLGNMSAWKAKQQAFSPRLLIYHGNNTGGPESATLSLDYEKENIGIIPKMWRRTADWWSERLPINGSFDIPGNILKHVIYNKCKKFRTREGEFVIEELRFTLFVDHISETSIKGYKV